MRDNFGRRLNSRLPILASLEAYEESNNSLTCINLSIPDEIKNNTDEIDNNHIEILTDTEALEKNLGYCDELEDHRNILEDSIVSNESLNTRSAELLKYRLESLYSKLNISQDNVMPSLESFNSSNSLYATKITLESLTENLSKGWNNVVTGLRSLKNKVSDSITKIMSQNTAIQNHANEIIAKARKIRSHPKNNTINSLSVVKAFGFKEKPTVKSIEDLLDTQGKEAHEILVESTMCICEMFANVNSLVNVEKMYKTEKTVQDYIQGVARTNEIFIKRYKSGVKTIKDNITEIKYNLIVNGKEPVMLISRSRINFKLDSISTKISDKTLNTLSIEEIVNLSKAVIGFSKRTENDKKYIKEWDGCLDEAIKVLNNTPKVEDKEHIKLLNRVKSDGLASLYGANKAIQTMFALNNQAAEKALEYVTLSLNQYPENN